RGHLLRGQDAERADEPVRRHGRGPRPRVGRCGAGHGVLARPGAAHRGARPVGASPQLPAPRPDQDRGRAGAAHFRGPAQHHQLRPEEPRRGHRQARRSRSEPGRRTDGERQLMPRPRKGPRLGGSPSHERLLLANLATDLFKHGKVVTTAAKARALRPLAEKMITTARKGDVHARRIVLKTISDKDAVHHLFSEVAPRYADRPGGYTRITKLGPRRGDGAEEAIIELV